MKLEDMLSEINQSQTGQYIVWCPLDEAPKIIKLIEMESRTVVTIALRRGGQACVFNRYRVSVWKDKKVLEMDGDD